MQKAATRSPGLRPEPSGALSTTPPTSLPGTKGSGGLSWYSPRVWSTSGNETPAACTSTSTPLSRGEQVIGLRLGQVGELERGVGPAQLGDLERAHGAGT